MLIRMSAAVLSTCVMQIPFLALHGDIEVLLSPGENRFLSKITLTKRLATGTASLARVDATKDPIVFDFACSSQHLDELRGLLQYLESILSYSCAVAKVDWENADIESIPENPEERREGSVIAMKGFARWYDPPIVQFHPRIFGRILRLRNKLDYLTIPMAFFREGMTDFRRHQYVTAFWKFYFFLEALFSKGKWRTNAVIEQFSKAPVLNQSIQKSIDILKGGSVQESHRKNIESMMDKKGWSLDPDHVTKFIVDLRGTLHHFSLEAFKSGKITGHPFNQEDFRSPAFLTMSICINCVNFTIVGEFNEEKPFGQESDGSG